MKICFATYPGITITGGGPLVKIHDLKHYLEKKGITVDLFDFWNAGKKLKDYDLFHIFGGNFAVYDLARHLKTNNVRYVVNPIIFSKHSSSLVRILNNLDIIVKKIVNGIRFDYGYTREICEWAEMVLPNTLDEGELISKGLSITNNKIKVIHNGVSERFLNGDPNLFIEKYGMDNFILSVGHLGPARKNGLALVEALSRINYPAVIIGKIFNGEGKKIKEVMGRNKNILHIDGVSNDSVELVSAYTACNTFVLPSRFETPGRAALEAGLAGAKIVITPYGGTKEYFKDMAEYVDPYSVDSIKKGIEKTLNKPKDNKLKEHIRQNFLWDKIADETIKVYKEVLNK